MRLNGIARRYASLGFLRVTAGPAALRSVNTLRKTFCKLILDGSKAPCSEHLIQRRLADASGVQPPSENTRKNGTVTCDREVLPATGATKFIYARAPPIRAASYTSKTINVYVGNAAIPQLSCSLRRSLAFIHLDDSYTQWNALSDEPSDIAERP
jgi:hypothetical protein